jgi:glucose-1-phosphate cytidylyltransferase
MQNHLKNKKVNVVLLCGGKGERLYPLTNDIPKPLLEIKNQPIISHIIKHLEKYNMTDLIIVTGYKSDKMENYVNKAYHAQNFRIIDSGDVDIISRIQDSLPFIEGDFMVLYGDTISNIDIDSLQKYHHLSDLPVTMAVWPLVSQFGVVEIDNNGTVIEFKEKPRLDKWINIGYFYFDSSMREMINESSSFAELLNRMSDERILGAYKHEGIHITVNTFKELTEAEKNINKI